MPKNVHLEIGSDYLVVSVSHGEQGYEAARIHRLDVRDVTKVLLRHLVANGKDGIMQELNDLAATAAQPVPDQRLFINGESLRSIGPDVDAAGPMAPTHRPGPPPWLGAEVIYRSRTGDYWLAAKVARTVHSSSPEALDRARVAQGRLYLVPLGLRDVDLVVFSSGGREREQSGTGTYVEHNIPYDQHGAPGTWCWPEDIQGGRP